MRVNPTVSTPDAYRQSQFYAGTHLSNYVLSKSNRLEQQTSNSFGKSVQQAIGQQQFHSAPSQNERVHLAKRLEHADREEHFQRLAYKNGVHYSVDQQLFLKDRK